MKTLVILTRATAAWASQRTPFQIWAHSYRNRITKPIRNGITSNKIN